MRPVDQTTFGHPGGNCFSACVASLLELPITDVPYFMDESEGRAKWHEQLDAWLEPRGFYASHFVIVDLERAEMPRGHFILVGRSPRGDHAVIARGRDVVHDPHPSRDGLLVVEGFVLLVPLFDRPVGFTVRLRSDDDAS